MVAAYTPEQTDPLGWRLKVSEQSHGQHKWVYLAPGPSRDAWPQDKASKYWSGMEVVCMIFASRELTLGRTSPGTAKDAVRSRSKWTQVLRSTPE